MDVFVNVIGQNIQINGYPRRFVIGNKEFIRFVFCLDDSWNDLLTYVQFSIGGRNYYSYLKEDNSVFLPPNITSGTCSMSLHGHDGSIVANTDKVVFTLTEDTLNLESFNEALPQSLYDQLAEKITNTKNEFDDKFEELVATSEEVNDFLGI